MPSYALRNSGRRLPHEVPTMLQDELPSMSILEHLEELRSRLLKALGGVGVAFVLSVVFTNELWRLVA